MKLVKFALATPIAAISVFLLAALSAQATMFTGDGEVRADGSYVWNDKANWGGSTPPRYSGGLAEFPEGVTLSMYIATDYFPSGTQCATVNIPSSSTITITSDDPATAGIEIKNLGNLAGTLILDGKVKVYLNSAALTGLNVTAQNGATLQTPANAVISGVNFMIESGSTYAAGAFKQLTGGSSITVSGSTMTGSLSSNAAHDGSIVITGGSTATFTDFKPSATLPVELSDNSTLTVTGCFYVNDYGADITISGKSTFTAASHTKLGKGAKMVIDDSTLEVTTQAMQQMVGSTADTVDSITFKGVNPVLRVANNISLNGSAPNGLVLNFEVPTGGYVQAPIQNASASAVFSNNKAGLVHVNVLETSPAISSGFTTVAQLVASAAGIKSYNGFDFAGADSAVGADAYLLSSGGGTVPATSDATATEMWVTVGEGPIYERPVTESKGVADGVKATVGKKDITLTATISQLANEEGYTTRLRVFAGTAADDLVEVTDEPVAVETKGEVAYVWDAPEYATDYFLKMTLETLNASESVVYSEDSPVVSARTWYDINNTATYIYIWNPEGTPNADGSYNWADKMNWDYYNNREARGHNGYPVNSGSNLAYFGPNVKARVCIDLSSGSPISGNRQLATIEVKPSAEIELFGTTTAYSFTVFSKLDATKLTVGEGLYLVAPVQKGVTIEVKEGGIINPNAALNDCTINVGEGGTLKTANALSLSNAFINVDAGIVQLTGNNGFAKVLDGGVTADNGSQLTIKSGLVLGPGGFFHLKGASVATWDSGTEYVKTGGKIWLEEKSTMILHGLFKTGAGVETIIDDSTLEIDPTATSNVQTYYMCDGAGGDTFVFRGENPILRTKALAQFSVTGASATEGKGAYFKFEIPQMGYLEPPIQHQGSGGSGLFGLSNVDASNGKVHIEVLPTSPALADGYDYKTETQLFTTTKGLSLNPARISTEAEPSASAVFEFTSSGRIEPTTIAADTKELWVTVGEGEIRGRGIKESKGVANGLTITKDARTFTIACGISQLANEPGYTTRIRVLGGESGEELMELGMIAVEQTGLTSYDWTVPEFAKDYDVKFVLETLNAGGAVTYTEESPIATDAAVDAATYTWTADASGDWNGNWTDKAHWADDKDGDCAGYPSSTECKVVVPGGNRVEITVDGAFSVKEVKCTGVSDVLFRTNAVGGTASTISIGGTFIVNNGSGTMTFDNVRLTDKNHIDFAGKKVILDNGASYAHSGSMSVSAKNAWVEVRNGSTLTVDKLWIGAGDKEENEGGLLVSNATASCSDLCGPINKDGHSTGWGYVKLQGTNPLLKVKSGCAAETAKATTRFVFEVPAGGYAATPFVFAGTGSAVCFNDTKANVSNIFTVVRSSTALKDSDVEYPLMSWNASGINREKVFFTPAPTRHGGTPRFTWLYGTAAEDPFGWTPTEGFGGTAVSIGFGVPMQPGFQILVR